MYESNEVILRLSSREVQQAQGIWLDNDADQALRFIKEKIVNRTLRTECKRPSGSTRKTAPCLLTRNNCICCRSGAVSRRA